VQSKGFFVKQILGGMFIMIAMTGLDQEMMQKNISVRNPRDSQKNVVTFSFVMVLVSFLFLLLGGCCICMPCIRGRYIQGRSPCSWTGGMSSGMICSPRWRLHYLPQAVSIIFIIGLISALFPSADGALTALTSSFCIDLLDMKNRQGWSEAQKRRTRLTVHVSFAIVFLLCILVFKWVNNKSIVVSSWNWRVYLWSFAGAFCLWDLYETGLPNLEDHGGLSGGACDLLLFSEPIFGGGWGGSDRARAAADQWDADLFGVMGLVPAEGVPISYICAKVTGMELIDPGAGICGAIFFGAECLLAGDSGLYGSASSGGAYAERTRCRGSCWS
jgi:hypothetical protein